MRKLNKRYAASTILITFALIGWSSFSSAACSQTDLTGVWRFTGMTGDTPGSYQESAMCKLTVSSSGAIISGSSSCVFRDGQGRYSVAVDGRIAVNSACLLSGIIGGSTITSGGFVIDKGSAMDKGKTVMSLALYIKNDPNDIGSLTGVKF